MAQLVLLYSITMCLSNCSFPVIVCGDPGSGKTSLMAKISSMLGDIGDPVIVRFLGTTGESGTTRELLRSLCRHITTLQGDVEAEIPSVSI